ncbi:RNA helicase [Malassezia yamatoensis]|uniref:RNA helicase n=1 Tax=Malassezia yamatoensis TaxID=253288 RepID=A0AAJ5YP96_9BASI|nr:RNA helicase [Malassezia yamatoensis]
MVRKKSSAAIKSSGATSSKAAPLPDWVKSGGPKPPVKTQVKEDGTALLFPPGSKTPLNLMYEKIQKIPDFEKPEVHPRSHAKGYTCSVTLRKINKQDRSNPHTLKLEPYEEGAKLSCKTALEAKHWAATYVLFRMYNQQSMHRILPPGPREYWLALEKVKLESPPIDSYKWESDPFDALQNHLAQRAAKKKERELREAQRNDPKVRPMSKAWQRAQEVRMSPALRELVESTIRARMSVIDEERQMDSSSISQAATELVSFDQKRLERELSKLGVRPGYSERALSWLSKARAEARDGRAAQQLQQSNPLLASILSLPDREAAIEYLILYTPEQDLPPALRPSASAESFVTGTASGGDQNALINRWTIEKLERFAGFPRRASSKALAQVRAQIPNGSAAQLEEATLDILLRQLVNMPKRAIPHLDTLNDEARQRRNDERTVLEALIEGMHSVREQEQIGSNNLALPLGEHDGASVTLRYVDHHASTYLLEHGMHPTIYVYGSTLPAFLCLALTRYAMQCFHQPDLAEDVYDAAQSNEGALYLLWERLSEILPRFLEDPPALDTVMEFLVEKRDIQQSSSIPALSSGAEAPSQPEKSRKIKAAKHLRRRPSLDDILKEQHHNYCSSLKYQEGIKPVREALPAFDARKDLLDTIHANRVVLIAGETGCGKTTQVPQFLLDDAIECGSGSECSIVVTQPRRVSAMGVAARVASERGESLDREMSDNAMVGYAIRGERRASRNCRLLFSTTGVLLRRLASGSDPDLAGVSHVIVDEVHERSTDSDFLLLLLRDVLERNKQIRVILMSATINPEKFVSYFGGAPYKFIPGRTFPVEEHYLEDVVRLTEFQSPRPHTTPNERLDRLFDARKVPDSQLSTVRQLVSTSRIDYELLSQAVRLAAKRAEKMDYTGSLHGRAAILVFCPGVGEIRRAMDAISMANLDGAVILPLHANLAPQDQRLVFQPVAKHQRKIVVSTNVAETSITIPEIGYVIDTGRVREAEYDAKDGVTRLIEKYASRAACKQRAGRAGRTMAGECYKLYSSGVAEHIQLAQSIPEIQRTPLEGVVLQVKAIQPSADIKSFLERAIDPPSTDALAATHEKLVLAGAIEGDKGYSAHLTALGRHLANLPLDVREGKLLVLGSLFGCMEPLLHVVALLASRPIIASAAQRSDDAKNKRLSYLLGNSDLLSTANLYSAYLLMRQDRVPVKEVKSWCEVHGLSFTALQDVDMTRSMILRGLEEAGIVNRSYVQAWSQQCAQWPKQSVRHSLDAQSTNTNLLRALITAALWPSVARIDQPAAKYNASASGAVLRDAVAKEFHFFDENDGRVFLHPSSLLFHATQFKSNYVAVCHKSANDQSQKTFLRDVTEASLYGLLLFGGPLYVDHEHGGLTIATSQKAGPDAWIKMKASARVGVLCRQLRQLLDATLDQGVENPQNLYTKDNQSVVQTMIKLVSQDGLE